MRNSRCVSAVAHHVAVRNVRELLAELRSQRRWRRDPIGNEIIDVGCAGGRGKSQVVRLHRRGAPRQYRHAVAGRMAGKIDEHVDAGRSDVCGKLSVGLRVRIDEAIDAGRNRLAVNAAVVGPYENA